MRYFFDTEFVEDGRTIDLISIGIVADDGREYYAEVYGWPISRASQWVIDNVVPHLSFDESVRKPRAQIRDEIAAFLGESPEIWAYYADYDWVAFCQLFGTMMDLPETWPKYCRDLKQLADFLIGDRTLRDGTPERLIPHTGTLHNALDDARWTQAAWHDLQQRGHP